MIVMADIKSDSLKVGDWVVRQTAHSEAVSFIRKHHYSKSCPRVRVYTFGLFREVLLTPIKGASVWLPPLPAVGAAVFPEGDPHRVLSLSRLAVAPEVPRNAASFLIGRSIREIKRDKNWDCLVTYADTRMGHEGGIYKATNWEYMGLTPPTRCWVEPGTGRQVSLKSTHNRTREEMKNLGYEMIGKFPKHRFRMVLK